MAESCLLGLQGKDNIYECAYVQSNLIPELSYFASKVRTPGKPSRKLKGKSISACRFGDSCAACSGALD